jgi:hypothetical protein
MVALAMGRKVIWAPLSIFVWKDPNEIYAKRRLTGSTALGQATCCWPRSTATTRSSTATSPVASTPGWAARRGRMVVSET